MTTLVVLQPSYLPWLGYFDQINRCDVFVFYDDVQFDKHGWRNRNFIKSAAGKVGLTVPVLHKGRMGQAINEVEIQTSQPWARKHLRTIEQAYARSPHLQTYLPPLAEILGRDWTGLSGLDVAVVRLMCGWLGLDRPMYLSSELEIPGNRNTRLLALCRHFGADRYLSGNAAKSYLDVELFSAHGIEVEWQDFQHPEYPQLHGAFIPYLSALDLVLNTGAEGRSVLDRAG